MVKRGGVLESIRTSSFPQSRHSSVPLIECRLDADMKRISLGTTLLAVFAATVAQAEQIGEVSTAFKLLGANHKIVIDAFDDPDIAGATCYVSRAKTGGVKGSLGLAEDTTDASIACRQTGPITLPEDVVNGERDGERVFRKSTSILFKKLQVVRFYDQKRNVLVYLTYSDKLIDGSPKNSISAIEVRPWQQTGK
ncbi:CreA family protein [Desulfobulbus sp. F5]|nr:CreA family protein [Desulfobulbus sp. F5]